MADNKVKVRVTDHHFKNSFNLGDKRIGLEPVEVEVDVTVRNAVQAGTLELVEGSLEPKKDEKPFQGDEQSGEESKETDEPNYEEMTKDELKELCEENDLKKSGTKDELIERVVNHD